MILQVVSASPLQPVPTVEPVEGRDWVLNAVSRILNRRQNESERLAVAANHEPPRLVAANRFEETNIIMASVANEPSITSTLLRLPSMLLRVPLHRVDSCGLPVETILDRAPLTRERLIAAVGSGIRVGGWSITYDAEYDRLNYIGLKPLPQVAKPRPTIRTAAAPTRIDPQQVGKTAREYQEAQRRRGREISATEAVAHVIAEQSTW